MATPSITSDEMNLLLFRYLQESGFTHSAFAFNCEAGVNNSKIDKNSVPLGALVRLVQKGLQYIELEANMDHSDHTDDETEFSFLEPIDLITKDASMLQQIVREKNEKLQMERNKAKEEVVKPLREPSQRA